MSDFHSDLDKLQANATFGKTMEQVWHCINTRLIADPNRLLKVVNKVWFQQREIINSELVMIRGVRTKVKLNKPIAVGKLVVGLVVVFALYIETLDVLQVLSQRC